jgi:hypothetical protein
MIHCKDKIPKFRNKYSQTRNIGVSVPILTFMSLWAIYIFSRSICLFCWRKYVDRSWDYINRSQTHECWNWGWGRAIPRKGIHKWDFRCSVLFAICSWKSATIRKNLVLCATLKTQAFCSSPTETGRWCTVKLFFLAGAFSIHLCTLFFNMLTRDYRSLRIRNRNRNFLCGFLRHN